MNSKVSTLIYIIWAHVFIAPCITHMHHYKEAKIFKIDQQTFHLSCKKGLDRVTSVYMSLPRGQLIDRRERFYLSSFRLTLSLYLHLGTVKMHFLVMYCCYEYKDSLMLLEHLILMMRHGELLRSVNLTMDQSTSFSSFLLTSDMP